MVKIFRKGKVVEEMHGCQPKPELRRIIDRHVPKASGQRITEALRRYRDGAVEGGLQMLAQAALDDPDNLRIPALLGKLLMAQARFDAAQNLLQGLPDEMRDEPEISHLLARVRFIQVARSAPDRAALGARLAADSDDAEVRYQLAALALVEDDYETAMPHLLELVQRHREFGEDAGRRGMLAVFRLLGNQGEPVDRYRALL